MCTSQQHKVSSLKGQPFRGRRQLGQENREPEDSAVPGRERTVSAAWLQPRDEQSGSSPRVPPSLRAGATGAVGLQPGVLQPRPPTRALRPRCCPHCSLTLFGGPFPPRKQNRALERLPDSRRHSLSNLTAGPVAQTSAGRLGGRGLPSLFQPRERVGDEGALGSSFPEPGSAAPGSPSASETLALGVGAGPVRVLSLHRFHCGWPDMQPLRGKANCSCV